MSDIISVFISFVPQPIIAAIIGLIGGAAIEFVDFYFEILEKECNFNESVELLRQSYPIRIAISALAGGLLVFFISITPVSAPIWQFVIGMSALGILSKFRHKKS